MKEPKIRKIVTNLEEVFYEGGADMPVENGEKKSIKTVSVAAVIKNPYAGKWQEDLSELTEYGEYLGRPAGPQGCGAAGRRERGDLRQGLPGRRGRRAGALLRHAASQGRQAHP